MVITERAAKKILDMDIQDLTKGMIKVLEVTNADLCDRLFLEICSNGWEFPIARIYCANKDKYYRDHLCASPRSAYRYYDPIRTFGLYDRPHPGDWSYINNSYSGDLAVEPFLNHLTPVQLALHQNGYDINYFDDNGFGNVLPDVRKITKEMFKIIVLYFYTNFIPKIFRFTPNFKIYKKNLVQKKCKNFGIKISPYQNVSIVQQLGFY